MKPTRALNISFILTVSVIVISYFIDILDLQSLLLTLGLLILFYLLSLFNLLKLSKDYKQMNETIENIINDKLKAKIISKFVAYRELNANLNRLVKKIEKMTLKKEEDQLTIQILTNNITSPIIYIDRDGRIRYVNNQFLNSFEANIEINEIYEKLRIKKIYKFIDDAFIFETKDVKIIMINDRYYQANAIPINNNENNHFSFLGILFIFHDITELKKYEKLQREFLADASHELKTPISAIKGASEILLNGENHSAETVREFLSIIESENARMERIVNDLLLISRLENDKVIFKFEMINLESLINEVCKILQIKLESKKQILHLHFEKDLFIKGDYERLKHAFLNLLSNAINYTDDEKSITIRTYQDQENVMVSIKDEGIGMDEESLSHIFERFYRVDKARSRATGGTGLGLAIVKSTLDIHKAKIVVNSKIDEGTEFIIYFNK